MEILIFFFVCIFAGVLAAYYNEHQKGMAKNNYPYGRNQEVHSVFDRLLKISRQI